MHSSSTSPIKPYCPLCTDSLTGVQLILQTEAGRIVRVTDTPDYPAFYRFIWHRHVTEYSDLSEEERHICMHMVYGIECALREVLNPTKINLASLGNMVSHLHWHVIARFTGDRNFPNPIWGVPPTQEAEEQQQSHFQNEILPKITARLPEIDEKIKSLVHSRIPRPTH